ncbi:hypothetical protein ATANTOWER_009026 [Ataeniobius toweri]|uniref:Uncharacterized protein n=1 Tax=Ataeniobius toweri TaxID=208326 RepID=A0ABU7AJ63_9TELE|nr:hypothetical protein [Ataeniobius toweri]
MRTMMRKRHIDHNIRTPRSKLTALLGGVQATCFQRQSKTKVQQSSICWFSVGEVDHVDLPPQLDIHHPPCIIEGYSALFNNKKPSTVAHGGKHLHILYRKKRCLTIVP